MGSRLLNMQRQMRELGRLRTGYSGPRGPVRSKTWILTSKERDLLDAAAIEWGGTVVEWTPLNGDGKQWSLTTETDRLPAFLPPGDPLTQANEMWNRGGATRRCDGVTEAKAGKPCLCLAQFGPDWHRQDKKARCQPYSHLNVMLLGLPDVGQWRHTTKSYYAAAEIAGMVDLIKARVGLEPVVPVWLIIDQRRKVADGTTTPYPVPIVKVRGAESGAALLSGRVPTLELDGPPQRQAIGSAPAVEERQPESPKTTARQLVALVRLAQSQQALAALTADAQSIPGDDPDLPALQEEWKRRVAVFKAADEAREAEGEQPQPPVGKAQEAEVEPDRDDMWMAIMREAGKRGWNLTAVEEKYRERMGHDPSDEDVATGFKYADFLAAVRAGQVA